MGEEYEYFSLFGQDKGTIYSGDAVVYGVLETPYGCSTEFC